MSGRPRRSWFGRSRPATSDQQPDALDPDVNAAIPAQRRQLLGHPAEVLAVIAAGGVVGAEARYALGLLVPHTAGAWPWATLIENAVGSALMGVLMVVIVELVEAHRLVRPFLGVGVLGGFTTFSTYAVDALTLTEAGRVGVAAVYVVSTPVVAVLSCVLGAASTRLLAGQRAVRRRDVEG